MVAVAYFAEDFHLFSGGCTGHPELERATGLPHARLEQLLMAVAKLGLETALQVRTQRYCSVALQQIQTSHESVFGGEYK